MKTNGLVGILASPWFLLFILLAWVFIAYIPALSVPAYLDDYSAIINNPRVTNHANLPQILEHFFFNRGLVQLSFAMEWHYFSEAIKAMHLMNVLYHLIATLLVYFCVRAIWQFLYPKIEQQKYWSYHGLIAASFFALHPINTQPVTYIISRANIFATIFFVLGILLSLKIISCWSPEPKSVVKRLLVVVSVIIAMSGCFALGLSSKEIIITLPVIFALLLVYSIRDKKPSLIILRIFLASLPVLLVFGAYLMYRKYTLGAFLSIPDMEARTPLTNLYTQTCIIVFYYIPRIVAPVNLLFRPTFAVVESLFDPKFLVAASAIMAALVVAVLRFRKSPEISFGILWFFIALAPTSSIIPIWDLVAERRIYLPSIGIAIIVESSIFALIKYKNLKWKKPAMGFFLSMLVVFSTLTLWRNFEYQNPVSFWQKEHVAAPNNLENLHNYLYRLTEAGQDEKVKSILSDLNWNEIKSKNEFVDGNSLDFLLRIMLHNNIEQDYATLLAKKNVENHPGNVLFLHTYQLGLMRTNKIAEALDAINQTLQINPRHIDTLVNKAILFRLGRLYKDANACLQYALKCEPDSRMVLDELVLLYESTGNDASQFKERIKALKKHDKYSSQIELKSSL
jgi:protein O-mannosyl-transferase